MGVVVSVLSRWHHGDKPLTFILELPEGVDCEAALGMLDRGESVLCRRIKLEPLPYSPEILGLPPSEDGERVRLIKKSNPWDLRPGTVTAIRDWRGSRIARIEE